MTTSAPNMGTQRKRQGHGGHTPAQDAMAEFIATALAIGYSPSVETIRKHMGWKERNSVMDCLRGMAAKGTLPKGYELKVRAS